MNKMLLKCGTLALTLAAATHVAAQDLQGTVGLQIGANRVAEYDQPTPELSTVGAATLNGRFAYQPNDTMIYAGDFFLRYDDFANGTQGDFTDNEDPELRGQIGLQALYALTDATRAGGFFSYADQRSQSQDIADEYDTWLLGLTAQTDLSDAFLGYAQLAHGSNTKGDDAGEGFNAGSVVRGGLVYFASDALIIAADLQLAGTPNYIDDDDLGYFNSFELMAEMQLGQSLPLTTEFGLRRSVITSSDEDDHLSEIEAFVGVNYNFGGASLTDKWRNGVAYGTPDLPARASAWTEWAD
ncbi:hypothetical protein [Yoonia sp. BS5-3]|uniref:Porin n=1 Tax=Yoonia phaeophyticola TaxID=3137369 RepID=A0ABZ2V883_9RHOB